MRHRRRPYLPGRQPCGPWRHQPPMPPSKRRTIIEGIIGIDIIIAVPITTVRTDGTVGTDGTVATDGTGIIGNKLGEGVTLRHIAIEKPAQRPAFLLITPC